MACEIRDLQISGEDLNFFSVPQQFIVSGRVLGCTTVSVTVSASAAGPSLFQDDVAAGPAAPDGYRRFSAVFDLGPQPLPHLAVLKCGQPVHIHARCTAPACEATSGPGEEVRCKAPGTDWFCFLFGGLAQGALVAALTLFVTQFCLGLSFAIAINVFLVLFFGFWAAYFYICQPGLCAFWNVPLVALKRSIFLGGLAALTYLNLVAGLVVITYGVVVGWLVLWLNGQGCNTVPDVRIV